MKKEKILKTQTKRQVVFVQSSLTSKNYSLHRETSFKTFDSFLRNLKQKQSCYPSKKSSEMFLFIKILSMQSFFHLYMGNSLDR